MSGTRKLEIITACFVLPISLFHLPFQERQTFHIQSSHDIFPPDRKIFQTFLAPKQFDQSLRMGAATQPKGLAFEDKSRGVPVRGRPSGLFHCFGQ